MLFNPKQCLLIAGPCALESATICHAVAEELTELKARYPDLNVVFKGSFDKANRTAAESPRGPGLEAGLAFLQRVHDDYRLPTITDCHTEAQAVAAAAICTVLQIPAFLCRQTDLLIAAARTGRVVNVKKGQFLAPEDMANVVNKLQTHGAMEIWQTERGHSFGYHNLVVDMRSFTILKTIASPVIFDATHSVQLPGAEGYKSGGQRAFIPPLARAALAAGADGLFIETHPEPEQALSDAATQLPLKQLPEFIEHCLAIWQVAKQQDA